VSSNDVILVGNLTRDVEIRFTNSGSAVATFDLAVNRRWQSRDSKEWEEEVSYFTVTAWRELAENVGESLSQGDRVMVSGRMQQRSWESREGEKRYKVEVVADEIGPSLRWATVEVTKNERNDNDRGSNGRNSSDRGSSDRGSSDRGSNGSSGRSARSESTRSDSAGRSNGRREYGRDEEPF